MSGDREAAGLSVGAWAKAERLMTAEQRLRYTEWGPGTIHAVVTRSEFVWAQIAMKRFMP